MQLLKLIGLFFVWVLILLLVGITWVTWSVQKCIIFVIMVLSNKFFPERKNDLNKYL